METLKVIFWLVCQYYLANCSTLDEDEKENCGILFSGYNETGHRIYIQGSGGYGDFGSEELSFTDKDSEKSRHWKDNVKSVYVYKNCNLQICSERMLKGECYTINDKIHDLSKQSFEGDIRSVACVCVQPKCSEPKCDSIQFGKRECARAFIEPGCATCNRTFLNFLKGGIIYMRAYEKEIRSLVVRKGCILHTYEDRDFEGDPDIYVEGTHEIWMQKPITTYDCKCNESYISPSIKATPPSTNLPLLDVPRGFKDVAALVANNTGHRGLRASLTSLRNRRSSTKSYILLIGATGTGKSSTINILFDNVTIAPVGHTEYTTRRIHEYQISVPVPELGLNNSELVIIDTPGLGDTDGVEADAKFLATLEEYLRTHEDLHDKLPNIVMIFGNFYSDRSFWSYRNTLRAIQLLRERIFDARFSNVIFVYTHYMSERRKVTKNPWNKLNDFREFIEEFTLLPKPINMCLAENMPIDHELPLVNGFYKFPNGEYYPYNLFQKIQETTRNCQDPIGEAIIRTAFKNSEKFRVLNEIVKEIHISNSSRFDDFHKMLMTPSDCFVVNSTEVSNLIEIAYNSLPAERLKPKSKDALCRIQKDLYLRNISTLNDVPRSTVEILKLLKGIRKSEVTRTVLERALGIKAPEIPNSSILVGNGYNVFEDRSINISPFQPGNNQPSDIEFMIPNWATLKIVNQIQPVFYVFDDKETYLDSRLKNNLKINGYFNTSRLRGEIRPGLNILSQKIEKYENSSKITLTALREHQLFKIILKEDPIFNPDFVAEVENIEEFNQTDSENVAAWADFFAKYGTHVVKSAFGGGAIEVRLTANINDTFSEDTNEVKGIMGKALKNIFGLMDDVYVGIRRNITEFASEQNVNYSFVFHHGGGRNVHTLDDMAEVMSHWDDLILYQPVMLQSSLGLHSLSEILQKYNLGLSQKISKAATSYFNACLEYVPPPAILLPPTPREDTEKIQTLNNEFHEQLNKLTSSSDSNFERIAFKKLISDLIKKFKPEMQTTHPTAFSGLSYKHLPAFTKRSN